MKKIGLIILVLGLTAQVFSQKAFTNEQLKYEFPKKEKKFHLANSTFHLSDAFLVLTQGIYLKLVQREGLTAGSITSNYSFIRFFENGTVFISFTYLSYPSKEEQNDLNYGKFGRYIIKDDIIKIEIFMNRQYGMMYMYAKLIPKGIQFYKISGRGIGQFLSARRYTEEGFFEKI